MSESDNRLLAMVATLYYVNNQSQKSVAELAGVSQAKVSRLLAEAREKGIVRISVGPFEPRDRESEQQLIDKLGLQEAVIVNNSTTSESKNKRTIGYFAAPIVSKMILPNSIVCVSAGRQIAQMVREMEPLGVPGVTVIQTMGGIGANVNEYDAVEIARRLAKLCGAHIYQLQTPTIADTVEEKEVFVRHKRVQDMLTKMDQADLAIIGVGILSDSLFIDREFFRNEDSERLVRKGAVGEICGRLFDADGNECDTQYKDRVISMSIDQLKKTPKVVAVTSGTERAPAVLAAAKGGIIKTLVSDEATARRILELI